MGLFWFKPYYDVICYHLSEMSNLNFLRFLVFFFRVDRERESDRFLNWKSKTASLQYLLSLIRKRNRNPYKSLSVSKSVMHYRLVDFVEKLFVCLTDAHTSNIKFDQRVIFRFWVIFIHTLMDRHAHRPIL